MRIISRTAALIRQDFDDAKELCRKGTSAAHFGIGGAFVFHQVISALFFSGLAERWNVSDGAAWAFYGLGFATAACVTLHEIAGRMRDIKNASADDNDWKSLRPEFRPQAEFCFMKPVAGH